jgi:hypothetical protein
MFPDEGFFRSLDVPHGLRRNTGTVLFKAFLNKYFLLKSTSAKSPFPALQQLVFRIQIRIQIRIRIDLALLDPDPKPHRQYGPGPYPSSQTIGKKKLFNLRCS